MNSKEYNQNYYKTHKLHIKTLQKEYSNTPMGRASMLKRGYIESDKKYGRGKGDLTAKWIVENIFTKPCAHCGKEGWEVIGCNRLDNSKPHTMDNVEPCCLECNTKMHNDDLKDELSKKVYQYTLDGKLVKIWNSTKECGRNGFDYHHISHCCNGLRKTHKGFKWGYA